MSEECTKTSSTAGATGRPALPAAAQGEIFGRLALCDKGSPEFRRIRRELAMNHDRTERAIDQIYARCLEDFFKKNGREPLTQRP